MADEKELRDLDIRLERLEQKLGTLGREPSVSALTEQDLAAYHKVQNAFWEDGSCGINETSPCILRCNIFKGGEVIPLPRPRFCDVECTCGPCNIGGLGSLGGLGGLGGGIRFRGLGD
jgi:hypothetical protein